MPLAALLNLSQKLTLQSTGAKPRSWQLRKAFVSKGIRPLSAGLSFHDLSPEQLVKSDQWDIFQHLWQIISHYKGALNSNDLNNNNESEKTVRIEERGAFGGLQLSGPFLQQLLIQQNPGSVDASSYAQVPSLLQGPTCLPRSLLDWGESTEPSPGGFFLLQLLYL